MEGFHRSGTVIMRDTTLSVLTKDQAQQFDLANGFHDSFLASARQAALYAFLTGVMLNSIKESCDHGDFMALCEQHAPKITHRSRNRFMLLASQIRHSVSNLPAINGRLSEKEEREIVEAFAQATDGKSLTQLYRDTGIIREKKHPVYTPPKPISIEDKIAADTALREQILEGAAQGLRAIHDMPHVEKCLIAPAKWDQFLHLSVSVSKIARGLRRRNRKWEPKRRKR